MKTCSHIENRTIDSQTVPRNIQKPAYAVWVWRLIFALVESVSAMGEGGGIFPAGVFYFACYREMDGRFKMEAHACKSPLGVPGFRGA